jgi:hypothetical protein
MSVRNTVRQFRAKLALIVLSPDRRINPILPFASVATTKPEFAE